jgi:hypothetical protein
MVSIDQIHELVLVIVSRPDRLSAAPSPNLITALNTGLLAPLTVRPLANLPSLKIYWSPWSSILRTQAFVLG